MAAPLVHLERILKIFVHKCGITKIRITGGEPTIHPYFDEYMRILLSLPLVDRAITTNGVLYKRMDRVGKICNRVNVSLDTLDRDKFSLISNRDPKVLDNVLKSLEILSSSSFSTTKVKINTVVMRGINDDELEKILRFCETTLPNVTVRFIELMPFNGNGAANKLFMSKDEILKILRHPVVQIPTSSDDPSRSSGNFFYSLPNGQRPFGIISSMTDAFCGSCNRVRLTSDGKLRNCLFSDTESETDLVGLIDRGCSDDEIESAIRKNILKKYPSHGGKHVNQLWNESHRNRSMISIGG